MSALGGEAWQRLRELALDAIPDGVSLPVGKPTTFLPWRTVGTFTVSGATSKRAVLSVNPVEFAEVMLAESELHLDHAVEHQLLIWKSLRSEGSFSPAWLTVTCYYWAFFLAVAGSRLTGKTIVFLDAPFAKDICALSGNGATLGAGAYECELVPASSVNSRDAMLIRKNGRLHDCIWKLWRRVLDSVSKGSKDGKSEWCSVAVKAFDELGDDWPSALRNEINYAPGVAYDAARQRGAVGNLARSKAARPRTTQQIVDDLNVGIDKCTMPSIAASEERLRWRCVALMDLSCLLHVIVATLRDDVASRRSLDNRWRTGRATYLRRHGMTAAEEWPRVT